MNWIGSTNRETQAMYIWHTAPQMTLADLTTKEMIVRRAGARLHAVRLSGAGARTVRLEGQGHHRYEATPKIHLAMERGEVHGTWANWSTLKAIAGPWLADKKVRILAQWGLRKHPEMPDVPIILDEAKTDDQKQALQLALARLEFGRPFFMPPSVPVERVNAVGVHSTRR